MPRRKFTVRRIPWKCYVPEDVAAKVDLLLLDTLRDKVEYGARSELVTQLLREWVAKQQRNGDNLPSQNVPKEGA